ncbi:MAG: protein kinase, partial [Deltaproteobacteria bacterium]|nr:protein kinase [Deltaproteobacteria bacterium]
GVHEAGRFANGEPFYAMPLLRGAPLGAEIEKRKTLAERLGLLANLTTVAEAIAYAHEQGIVHRDIKPDNILIGAFGETVVIDWGLAKDISEQGGDLEGDVYRAAPVDGLTQFGVGTANYMPPEQAKGDEPEPGFDVYALGATLYHLLAGKPPHSDANDSSEIRRRLMFGTPHRPLVEVAPDVPPELVDIVTKAMAPERAQRLESARELARELRRYQTGQLLASRRYSLGELVRHWMRKHRTALRISAIAGAVVLALAVFAFVRIARERDRATASQARAERELRRAQGIVASRSAADPVQRLDAILLGIRAVAPDLAAGAVPVPEAVQGLTDALTAGPPLVPLRHEGVIKWFAPAGDKLIGVDDARALVVWDAKSGARIASYPSELPQPERPRVSPDGKRVVVCGFDPIGEVFELSTGAHQTFKANGADFAGCAFLPDGRVVTAADDVSLRDPATLAVVKQFPLSSRANSLALSPSGTVAVTTIDGTLWLWDGKGEPTSVATRAPLGGRSAFDQSGTLLYQSGNDQVVRAFEITKPGAPWTELYQDRRSNLASVLPSPAGDRIAVGMWNIDGARRSVVIDRDPKTIDVQLDGSVQAWSGGDWTVLERFGPLALASVETGGTVLPLAAHGAEATTLAMPDRLATASRDGPAFLWDITSGDATGMLLGHSGEVSSIVVRGDAILTTSHDGSARLWNAADGRAISVLKPEQEILATGWLANDTVMLGDITGRVTSWKARTGEALEHSPVSGQPISAIAVSPDGARAAFGNLAGGLRDFSREYGPGLPAVTALVYTADGKRLISSHTDGAIRAWDTASGALIATRPEPEPVDMPSDHEGDIALYRDGDSILAVRPAGTTRVLADTDLAVRATLDGRVVALGEGRHVRARGEGTLIVKDRAGERRLTDHRAAITAAALSADGSLLASASVDGSVRLWDPAREQAAVVVIAPVGLGIPTAVAFAGSSLIIGFSGGGVRMVPTTAAGAIVRACGIARRFGRTADVAPYCD